MPSPRRRRSEELALIALLGASVGAAAWLAGRWRERAQRWQRVRQINRGLALQSSHTLSIENERHNGHDHNSQHDLFSAWE